MASKDDGSIRVVFYDDALVPPMIGTHSSEAVALMKRAAASFEDEANELSGLTSAEWAYQLRVIHVARRRLQHQHDLEVCELAAKMLRDALARTDEPPAEEPAE
jgi:hypothetical protein